MGGGSIGTRTQGLRIKNALLYQLSYTPFIFSMCDEMVDDVEPAQTGVQKTERNGSVEGPGTEHRHEKSQFENAIAGPVLDSHSFSFFGENGGSGWT